MHHHRFLPEETTNRLLIAILRHWQPVQLQNAILINIKIHLVRSMGIDLALYSNGAPCMEGSVRRGEHPPRLGVSLHRAIMAPCCSILPRNLGYPNLPVFITFHTYLAVQILPNGGGEPPYQIRQVETLLLRDRSSFWRQWRSDCKLSLTRLPGRELQGWGQLATGASPLRERLDGSL